ncbi:MAG: hypothetical protein ACI9DJ_002955 [Algoriphagus sp.]|jgi:hypothetical protein
MAEEIINKVASSGLVSFNLEDYYHSGERVVYDLKDNLFMEMILKEKDFRVFLKEHDWSLYQGKNVAILCSADVIIPTWAYMLLVLKLGPVANCVVKGTLKDLELKLFQKALLEVDFEAYRDSRVVVKGCSKVEVPAEVYVELTQTLQPIVKSLMFGEPCSTVPLYKKPR